jgi:hypothetical protein
LLGVTSPFLIAQVLGNELQGSFGVCEQTEKSLQEGEMFFHFIFFRDAPCRAPGRRAPAWRRAGPPKHAAERDAASEASYEHVHVGLGLNAAR